MIITIKDLRYLSELYKSNKQYIVKYKNRYWRWDNNENKETILISKDRREWRSPKGKELEIIRYL